MVDGIAGMCETELVVEFEVKESMFRIGTREVVSPSRRSSPSDVSCATGTTRPPTPTA